MQGADCGFLHRVRRASAVMSAPLIVPSAVLNPGLTLLARILRKIVNIAQSFPDRQETREAGLA
jgi:hypothetical protein